MPSPRRPLQQQPNRAPTAPSPAAPPPMLGLHHVAYRCRDAEETRAFYEDLLGLPLLHVIRSDTVPSTGERCPYAHIFFELGDGSCVAFFDLGDGQSAEPSPNTPAWVQHIAWRARRPSDLPSMKDRLERAGVEVLGPVDHGIFVSIYFFDPNGVRLELCAQKAPPAEMEDHRRQARSLLDAWTREKGELGPAGS